MNIRPKYDHTKTIGSFGSKEDRTPPPHQKARSDNRSRSTSVTHQRVLKDLSDIEPAKIYIAGKLADGPRRVGRSVSLEVSLENKNSSLPNSMAVYNSDSGILPGEQDHFLAQHVTSNKTLSNNMVSKPQTDGTSANAGIQMDSSSMLYTVEPVREREREPFPLAANLFVV